MDEALERLYQWYLIGCRVQEKEPMSRDEFVTQHLLELLGGGLATSAVLDRTNAEWELAREDAYWTTILQRLRNLNLTTVTSDLVAAIQAGRDADEGGPAGDAGVPARRPPFFPILSGAAALELPGREPMLCDLVGAGPSGAWSPR
jgi:hypothetical protein